MAEWWQTFFHGVVLDMWRLAVTDEQTEADADRIQKLLDLPPGAKLLDAPAGNGRIALKLAERGYQVSGIDIADDYVAEASQRAKELNVPAEFRLGDMRQLPWQATFDGIYCTGNSFGYCEDAGNAQFLQSIAGALRSGGKLLLETPLVAEAILSKFQANAWYQLGDLYALANRRFDVNTSRLHVEYTFIRGGIVDKRDCFYRVYPFRELCELVRAAGLQITSTWATPDGAPFTLGSGELLLIATKL